MSDTLQLNFHDTIDFEKLMATARKHITDLTGALWTDHNATDPGITQLEVLAFCIADLSYRTSFPVNDILAGYKNEKNTAFDLPLPDVMLPNAPVTIRDLRKLLIDIPHPLEIGKLLIRNAFPIIATENEMPLYATYNTDGEAFLSSENLTKDNGPYEHADLLEINGLYNIQIEFEDGDKMINDIEVEQHVWDLNQNYFEQEIVVGNETYTISVLMPYWDELDWSLKDVVLNTFLADLDFVRNDDQKNTFFAVDKLNYDDYFYDYYSEVHSNNTHSLPLFIKIADKQKGSIHFNGATHEFTVDFLDWNELSNGLDRNYTVPYTDLTANFVGIDKNDSTFDLEATFNFTKKVVLLTRISFTNSIFDIADHGDICGVLSNEFQNLFLKRQAIEAAIEDQIIEPDDFSDNIYTKYITKINTVFDYLYGSNSTQNVWSYINQYRNLGEDFLKFSASRIQEIALFGKLIVEPSYNINEILSEVYFQIHQFLHPSITFHTLAEMTEKGYQFEDIFNGPLLQNGFIENSNLDDLQRRSTIYTSDLIRIIMNVEGVEAVEGFSISSYIDNRLMGRNVINCLSLTESDVYKPRLSVDKSLLNVCLNDQAEEINKQFVKNWYNNKIDEFKSNQIPTAPYYEVALPSGIDMEIEQYQSIQNDFPDIYGIGDYGLPLDATEKRKAQAKQLKAFLLPFEQMLANYLQQVSNLAEVFSFGRNIENTYAWQPLYEVPDVQPLFSEWQSSNGITWDQFKNDLDNSYSKAIQSYESEEEFRSHRHRFLNQLLARFGESFTDYAKQMFDQHKSILNDPTDPNALQNYLAARAVTYDKVIEDEISFGESHERVSSERYQSFNTANLPKSCLPTPYEIINQVGIRENNSIIKNVNNNKTWDKSGGSINVPLSEGDYMTYQVQTNVAIMVGFSVLDKDAGYRSINYALYTRHLDNKLYVYENGVNKAIGSSAGTPVYSLGTYDETSVLKIAIEDGKIKYYKDNVALAYESTIHHSGDLIVDFAMYHPKSEIRNLEIFQNCGQVDPNNIPFEDNIGSYKLRLCGLLGIEQTGNIPMFGIDDGQGNISDVEGMHILEHTLLRPRTNQGELLALTNRNYLDNGSLSFYDADKDPYSFKVTIVLPIDAGRFVNKQFRKYVNHVIEMDTPAHVLLDIKWMSSSCGKAFEEAYLNWKEHLYRLVPYQFQTTLSTTETTSVNQITTLQNEVIKRLTTPCSVTLQLYNSTDALVLNKFYVGTNDVFNIKVSEIGGILKVYKRENETWVEKYEHDTITQNYFPTNEFTNIATGITQHLGGAGTYKFQYELDGEIVNQLIQVIEEVIEVPDVIPYINIGHIDDRGNPTMLNPKLYQDDKGLNTLFRVQNTETENYFLDFAPASSNVIRGLAQFSVDGINWINLSLNQYYGMDTINLQKIYDKYGTGIFHFSYEIGGIIVYQDIEIYINDEENPKNILIGQIDREGTKTLLKEDLYKGAIYRISEKSITDYFLQFDPALTKDVSYTIRVQFNDTEVWNIIDFYETSEGITTLNVKLLFAKFGAGTYRIAYGTDSDYVYQDIEIVGEDYTLVKEPTIRVFDYDKELSEPYVLILDRNNLEESNNRYYVEFSPKEAVVEGRTILKDKTEDIDTLIVPEDNHRENVSLAELGAGIIQLSISNAAGIYETNITIEEIGTDELKTLEVNIYDHSKEGDEALLVPQENRFDLIFDYQNVDQFFNLVFNEPSGELSIQNEDEEIFENIPLEGNEIYFNGIEEFPNGLVSGIYNANYKIPDAEPLDFEFHVININPTFELKTNVYDDTYFKVTASPLHNANNYIWRIDDAYVSRAKFPTLAFNFKEADSFVIKLTMHLDDYEASYEKTITMKDLQTL